MATTASNFETNNVDGDGRRHYVNNFEATKDVSADGKTQTEKLQTH